MIRYGRADWMVRHLIGEAMPELKHLRSDAAQGCLSVSRKYSIGAE